MLLIINHILVLIKYGYIASKLISKMYNMYNSKYNNRITFIKNVHIWDSNGLNFDKYASSHFYFPQMNWKVYGICNVMQCSTIYNYIYNI